MAGVIEKMEYREGDFMSNNKRRLWVAGMVAGVCVVFCLFGLQESPFVSEMKHAEFCRHLMGRLAFALFQYAGQHGQFPDSLSALQEHGLIGRDHFGCPRQAGSEYVYLAGVRSDMPENMPLLVEAHAPHLFYANDGRVIPYGMVLYLDGSQVPTARDLLPDIVEQARRALAVMRGDTDKAAAIIASPSRQTYLMHAAALWRLRQEKQLHCLPAVREYLSFLRKNRTLGMSYQGDIQCAGRQAAYLLWPHDRKLALPELTSDMTSHVYSVRKRAWQMVFPEMPPQLPPYAFISMTIPEEAAKILQGQ